MASAVKEYIMSNLPPNDSGLPQEENVIRRRRSSSRPIT